jgi:DNA polymerase alpha subunit B
MRLQVAEQIIEGMQKELMTSPAKKMSEYHHSKIFQNGQALSVVAAAGPFTTADNLEYEPLEELLSLVATSKPDVLVLMGPFVDSTHPILQGGDATLFSRDDDGNLLYGKEHDASYEMVFIEKVIRDGLGSYFNSASDFGGVLPTQIILVPSLLDAHHECVFPQPPFGDRDRLNTTFFTEPLGSLNVPNSSPDDPGRRVYLASNPCMFRYAWF